MIIAVKESKVEKVNPSLFNICFVSKKGPTIDGATNMDILLPTDDLYIGRKEGTVGKKKFEKKYSKYLHKKNTYVEWAIYSIGRALASKPGNICFVCTDEEYELGYLRILGETIAEMFGVDFETGYKEAKELIDNELEVYTKKERKAFEMDDDDEDMSDKKAKMKKYVTKEISKSLRGSMSVEGSELMEEMSTRFAIDQLALKLAGDGVLTMNKSGDGVKSVDVEKFDGKSKDIVEIIMQPKEDEDFGPVVKAILKGYGVKYKYEDLKDLGKEKLIQLVGELYIKLGEYRSGSRVIDND